MIPRALSADSCADTNHAARQIPNLPVKMRQKVYISINRGTPNLIHPALASVAGVMLRLRRQQTTPRAKSPAQHDRDPM